MLRDDLGELGGLEREQLGPGRLVAGVGHAQHDAVVARDGVRVDAELLLHARADRERPRGVHAHAVGRVQHDAPVAELVAEALDHEVGAVGHDGGGRALVVDERDEVLRGALVRSRAAVGALASSVMNPPIASPSSAGRPMPSPFQNGSRPGSPAAGATSTRSCVISWMRQLVAPSAKTSPTRDS